MNTQFRIAAIIFALFGMLTFAGAQTGAQQQSQAETTYQNAYLQGTPAAQAQQFDQAAKSYDEAAKAYAKEGDAAKADQMRAWARAARSNADSRRKSNTAATAPLFLAGAKGTGRTTGHVANVTVVNTGDHDVEVNLSPCFIPSDGRYQPYVVPEVTTSTIPAKSSADLPLLGYCADIYLPPVPAGAALPTFSKWVFVSDQPITGLYVMADPPSVPEPMNPPSGNVKPKPGTTAPVSAEPVPVPPDEMNPPTQIKPFSPSWTPATQSGWAPGPDGGATVLVPGTDKPLEHTLDINKHPKEAAAILLVALTRIAEAYDKLHEKGAINTPFSSRPDKERESVIQQTFWLYTSELTGKEYKVSDFKDNTVKQFEKGSGRDYQAMKPEEQQPLNQGIAQFWNTFEAVGAEAKVLAAPTVPADAEDWGKIIEARYQEYVAYREMGDSHEQALKTTFANEEMRKTYGDKFKERYFKDKKK